MRERYRKRPPVPRVPLAPEVKPHPDIKIQKNREKAKAFARKAKLDVVKAYGGRCQCPGGCAIALPAFLTIDHIYNDGKADRLIPGKGLSAIYRWLRANGYPKDRYRLLCYNCNMGRDKTPDKRCPHERMHLSRVGYNQLGSVFKRANKRGTGR